MSNNFKVGDYVVRTESFKGTPFEEGKEYKVVGVSYNGMYLSVEGIHGNMEWLTRCFKKVGNCESREELEKAIKLVVGHNLKIDYYSDGQAYFIYSDSHPKRYTTQRHIDSVLNQLYPTETPEAKELKKIEEEMAKLTKRMEELRGKL